MKAIFILSLISVLFMADCSGSKTFPELGGVTKIEVRTNERENIKTII
jgi:hypothetical protein